MPRKDKEKDRTYKRERARSPEVKARAKITSAIWHKSKEGKEKVKERYLERKNWLISLKDFPCNSCGIKFHPAAMDWHHLDPTIKSFELNAQCYNLKKERILEELEKCDLLCSNCHRILHNSQKGG